MTPPPAIDTATGIKTLTIDGVEVGAHDDQTIFEVAKENNINIPVLCNVEGLPNLGACRLCVVEVKGARRLLPACATQIQEGMEVQTNTEKIQKYRKMVLELLFSERNHTCSVCVSNGKCELQGQAKTQGVDHVHVPYLFPKHYVDASHPKFIADQNRCILCQRCVRVCDEIEGAHTWDVMGRGIKSKVITDMDQPWGKSETCTHCGKCVQVCPTGALSEKGRSVAEMVKKKQFIPYLNTMRKYHE